MIEVQLSQYKILKVLIVIGFLVGNYCLFGLVKTMVFVAVFFLLSLLVHLVYRIKTEKCMQTWLDFVVVEENGAMRPTSIGKYYNTAVILNAILAIVISQVVS